MEKILSDISEAGLEYVANSKSKHITVYGADGFDFCARRFHWTQTYGPLVMEGNVHYTYNAQENVMNPYESEIISIKVMIGDDKDCRDLMGNLLDDSE